MEPILGLRMWCVVHEGTRVSSRVSVRRGWDIEDVTNLTLEAKWGSYMEAERPEKG